MLKDASALSSRWDTNKSLPETFSRTLGALKRTIDGLYKEMRLGRTRVAAPLPTLGRVKYIWGEKEMETNLVQLRGQSANLTLLLNVVQTSVYPGLFLALI
jgi:hypothetical protein